MARSYFKTRLAFLCFFFLFFVVYRKCAAYSPYDLIYSLVIGKKREVKITDIMTTNPKIVNVNDKREDIGFLFDQYELTSAPVVDARGRLIGMITVDDVVDLIRQKADEDMYKLGGVTGEGDLYLAAFKTARSRFGWLAINLITAIFIKNTSVR